MLCRDCLATVAMVALFLTVSGQSDDDIEVIELSYSLEEEVQSGTFVADIFRDAEIASLYAPAALSVLYFRFMKSDVKNFTITNRTGIIKTQGRMDREALCPNQAECSTVIDVVVQPMNYFRLIKVKVDIRDKNDNAPRFTQPVVSHSVLESALPGLGFVIPSPIDQDSPQNSVSRYELQPRGGPFKLSITSKVDGSQEIQLVLNASLDREKQHQYTFQLVAYDGGSPPNYGTVEIQINILDANDNHPVFDQPNYEVSIPENVPRHTTIIQVNAIDPDLGHNGDVIYSFSERTRTTYGHLFGLKNRTGEVYIKDDIDYETSPIFHLSIEAKDQGPDSIPEDVTLVVKVTDINDHAPEILINTLSDSGRAEVAEGSPINTFVAHITVKDSDSGDNKQFNCTLNDNSFRIRNLYEGEFQLVTSAYLDREIQESYAVTLSCTDHGKDPQTAVKTIPITVKDINDHAPTFTDDSYAGELIENNYRGAFVVRVNATDADHGANAKITYTLPQDMTKYFSIDAQSGVIRAQTAMDREVLDQVRFYVTATDDGDPPLSSSALVIVDIQDVNDKAPKFNSKEYTFAIFENEPPGTDVGQVTAEDEDSSLYNVITYTFLPSHTTYDFMLDASTGQISSRRPLDREHQPVYYLEVLARDKGSPALSGSCSVTIYVNDRNDHAPVFDYPSDFNNTIYLSNQVPKGYVVTRVTAHDLDIGSNAKVTYDIHSGNEDSMFDMDPVHGTLVVKEGFQDINSKVYQLSLVAQDNGEPQNMAFSHLNLVVNKSVPFPLANAHHGPLIGQNFTIVISVACVSALVIVVLVIAIVCLKRQDVDRQARKYNCRMQALHVMSKDAESQQNTKTDNLWMSDTNSAKCNGNSPPLPDTDKFSPATGTTVTEDVMKTPSKTCGKDGQQKVWPTAANQPYHQKDPSYMNIKPVSSFSAHTLPAATTSPSVTTVPAATAGISTFNPNNPPVGVVAPSSSASTLPGSVHSNHSHHGNNDLNYPPGYGRESHPVSVERWRQNLNNRREMQVHAVLDLLKSSGGHHGHSLHGHHGHHGPADHKPHGDSASLSSGHSSNTDSGVVVIPRHTDAEASANDRMYAPGVLPPRAPLYPPPRGIPTSTPSDRPGHWQGILT